MKSSEITVKPQSQEDSLDSKTRAHKVQFCLAIVLLLLPAVLCFLYIRAYGVNVVYWDQWEIVPLFEKLFTGHLTFSDLFAQQNEHLIFFPRLVMLLLGSLTHFNTLAEMYFSFFLICATGLILLVIYIRSFGSNEKALFQFVPVVWLLFSLRQWENLLWGFQIAFFMVILFLVLSLYLLSVSQKPGWRLVLSLICGIVCSFSLSNGLLVWPIGLLQILFFSRISTTVSKRSFVKTAVIWAIVALCVYIAYFINYVKPVNSPSIFYFLQHPISAVKFLLAAIGSPLATDLNTVFGIGLILGLLYVWVIGFSLVRGLKRGPSNPFIISLALFGLSTIVILFFGRSGWGVDHAFVSRYTTITALTIAGIYLLLLLYKTKHENIKLFLLGCMITLIIVGLISTNLRAIGEGQAERYTRKMDAYWLSSYQIQSDKMLAGLYPYPQTVKERVGTLEKYNLSVFNEAFIIPQNLSLVEGLTLYDLFSINDRAIAKSNTPIFIDSKVEDTIIITGWAVDSNSKNAAGGLFIIIDGQKDLPALYGIDRKDVADYYHETNYRYTGFYASFAASILDKGQHTLSVKIVTPDKKGYYQPEQKIMIYVK